MNPKINNIMFYQNTIRMLFKIMEMAASLALNVATQIEKCSMLRDTGILNTVHQPTTHAHIVINIVPAKML